MANKKGASAPKFYTCFGTSLGLWLDFLYLSRRKFFEKILSIVNASLLGTQTANQRKHWIKKL